MLEQEFQYFLDHQQELAEMHPGKYVVIVGSEVVGVFNSESEAYQEAIIKFEPGKFLIQKCEHGKESYTQSFHSRVTF